jgi:hypothetical protein
MAITPIIATITVIITITIITGGATITATGVDTRGDGSTKRQ